jgi:hypothetical protein
MSEGFRNLQTFKAPAAKLPRGEASRLPSALNVAAMLVQSAHRIKASSETAIRSGNVDDEQKLAAVAASYPFLKTRTAGHR